MLAVAGFSGLCSLVYQVVWDRTLRFNFGGDTVASAIVTASFLLGLGLGALVFGRWRANPIRTLALLELGIGGFAIVSYPYLTSLATALGAIMQSTVDDAGGLRAAVIAGCILFIVPPSVLMGGSLPLLLNWFVPDGLYASRTVGMVYGLNTLGAATGILVAPFVFLNNVSIPTTLAIVGSGNVAFAAVLLMLSRRPARFVPTPSAELAVAGEAPSAQLAAGEKTTSAEAPPRGISTSYVLLLSFISGFVVLAFEMSALRSSFVVRPSHPYNFPAVLMPFLLAMAAGSMLFTRFRLYSQAAALRRLGLLFIGAPLAMMAAVGVGSFAVFHQLSMAPGRYLLPYLVGLVVPYALLSGGVFPLLLKVASATGRDLPGRTGIIYLVNSVGSFSGALAAQFLGFPLLGTRYLLSLLFIAGVAAGTSALLTAHRLEARRRAPLRPPWLWPAAALLLLVPALLPETVWTRYALGLRTTRFDAVEGSSGMATIEWNEDASHGDVRVNNMIMSALPDHPKHVRLAGVALSLPRRERMLVLGLGGGGMVKRLIADPGVGEIDVVDWSAELPAVLSLPRAQKHLGDTLERPDVHPIHADARVAVALLGDDRYDVIIDNLAAGGWAGATNIKSVAYYREIARILAPAGVFVYDANYSTPAQRRANLAALLTAFDHVAEHPDWIVLASNRRWEIDLARIERVFAERPELDIDPPYAEWLLGNLETIRSADLAGVEPIRDELPIHEYTVHPLRGALRRAAALLERLGGGGF
jgi:predicted membrane-bound spermidine synthase